MNLDERAATARSDLGTVLDDVDAPPAAHVRTVHRRRRALQAGAGALAVAVAAVGVVALVERDDHKEPVILTPPSTDTTVPVGVTSRLELSTTTVESGGTIVGYLVVENNTGAPLALSDRCAIRWFVVLTNASTPLPPEPLFEQPCNPVIPLAIGTSNFPITLQASHATDPQQVLLPPGEYEAVLVTSDSSPLDPEPVPVTVTANSLQTTTTAGVAAPTFPEASQPTHGGTTWAVVIAGAFVEPGAPLDANQTLNSAVGVAARGGYTTGPTDCDQGADIAWGVSPDAADFYSVSVYFGSEADARQANEAFKGIGWNSGVVAQVQTFCLD